MLSDRQENGALAGRAIAGSHVVVLAWNVSEAGWHDFTGTGDRAVVGFAIERADFGAVEEARVTPVEKYWLRGMKRFEQLDTGSPPGSEFPLSEHPVQGFQWGDYTAKPRHRYIYRLVPVRGRPKLLTVQHDEAIAMEVTTEAEDADGHGVWFNRGVAASQAYARRFPGQQPDQEDPTSEQMRWLSRGLFEALLEFIERAEGPGFSLRGALYEFRYAPVVQALMDAAARGVDVEILYDDPNYGDENREIIKQVGLGGCRGRSGNKSQKHNKFLVLLQDETPVAVWTGSTNISAGGIFGHSNVGHSITDEGVARHYHTYWKLLSEDPTAENKDLRDKIVEATPNPADDLDALRVGMTVMFSPRRINTLDWYAKLMRRARQLACFTVAFSIDSRFEEVLDEDTETLRYILEDKVEKEPSLRRDKDVVLAVGARLGKADLDGFLPERLTGFNKNLYIHDKFMLIDPLGDDPIVVSGSANFSAASMSSNDENMLVIRGNQRVAHIYFGEFLRLFDHLYVRHIITRVVQTHEDRSRAYLAPDSSWTDRYRDPSSVRGKRRRYFSGSPEGV